MKTKKNRQIRFTNQKMAIWEYLKGVKTHPSAEDVYNEVKKILPRITLATVYRNLKSMAQEGIVQEISDKILRYDGDTSLHAHFICEKCDKIYDIFGKCGLIKPTSIKVGKIKKHQIYFYGKCKNC